MTSFSLDNGLEVVVLEDHRAPVVTHMVWYKVGAADEPAGKSGLAHFLEHLMFKGTSRHPDGRFSQIVAEIGGQENAFTSSDYTAYFQRVAVEHLGLMMELEADRMAGLMLSEEAVKPEREVILEEQATRVANEPGAQLGEELAAALFRNHPYGRPIIGWRHEIEGLTREDAITFYKRWYAPNNAVLVVAGDVTVDEVRALAERHYGPVFPIMGLGRRQRPREPLPRAHREVVLAHPRVEQPSLSKTFLVPSYTTGEGWEGPALDVLAHIIGGGATSRLYRALVVEGEKAASAGGWYSGTALDDTRFGIGASPRPGVALDDLSTMIDAVIARFVDEGPTDAEMTRTRARLVADQVYAQDSQSTLARLYGMALSTGAEPGDVAAWPGRIRAVTADQVRAVAERYLVPERAVTGRLVKTARAA